MARHVVRDRPRRRWNSTPGLRPRIAPLRRPRLACDVMRRYAAVTDQTLEDRADERGGGGREWRRSHSNVSSIEATHLRPSGDARWRVAEPALVRRSQLRGGRERNVARAVMRRDPSMRVPFRLHCRCSDRSRARYYRHRARPYRHDGDIFRGPRVARIILGLARRPGHLRRRESRRWPIITSDCGRPFPLIRPGAPLRPPMRPARTA
jgi:hypothetical protein